MKEPRLRSGLETLNGLNRYEMEDKGDNMSWRYGVVKTKLDDGTQWYYLAEIYGDGGHSNVNYLGGISGESVGEVINMIDMIRDDLRYLKVIEYLEND
jgi:hypothetical protein